MENNKIFHGDCAEVLSTISAESVNLIYLDPPFFTGKSHTNSTRDGETQYSFNDQWRSLEEFSGFLTERIKACKRILRNDGSIFVHCDHNGSHVVRRVLDSVFGKENFQSEIIWTYKRWSNSKRGLMRQHQNILFYSRGSHFKWNPIWSDYSATTNVDQIMQRRTRDSRGKAVYATDVEGKVIYGTEKRGVPLGDVWEIPYLNPKAKERCGYPTQKPLILLERIVELTTDIGDLVVDPFCGSGTTLVAAKLLGRNFVGVDISSNAIELAEQRLSNPVRTESALLKDGIDTYFNNDPWVGSHLTGFSFSRVHRNLSVDAVLKTPIDNKAVYLRIQRRGEKLSSSLEALTRFIESRGNATGIVIATADDLFPSSSKIVRILPSPALQLERMQKSSSDSLKEPHLLQAI